jgi:hypothetical protein
MDIESQIPMPVDEQTGCVGILLCVYMCILVMIALILMFDIQVSGGFVVWVFGFAFSVLICLTYMDPQKTRQKYLKHACRDPVTRAHALRGSFNIKQRGRKMIFIGLFAGFVYFLVVANLAFDVDQKIQKIQSETNMSLPFDTHTK